MRSMLFPNDLGARIRDRVHARLKRAFGPHPRPEAPAPAPTAPSRPPMPRDRAPARRRGDAATVPLPAEERAVANDAGELTPQAVLEATNAARAAHGLAPLTLDPALSSVAQGHADDMAARGFFDHTNPDGLDPFARMAQAGIHYGAAAENIAEGQRDADAVLASWMNSPGHRANLLNPEFTTLGVGIAQGPDGPIWTQNFTG